MSDSIQRLRVYTTAREFEDNVYELIKQLPSHETYPLGNDLRRASSSVSHHISEAHRCYSYTLKLEHLNDARRAAEVTSQLLASIQMPMVADQSKPNYNNLIQQLWGFIHYLKKQRHSYSQSLTVSSTDELVAARV